MQAKLEQLKETRKQRQLEEPKTQQPAVIQKLAEEIVLASSLPEKEIVFVDCCVVSSQKGQHQLVVAWKNQVQETVNQLAKCGHPRFLQYLAVQMREEKHQKKEKVEQPSKQLQTPAKEKQNKSQKIVEPPIEWIGKLIAQKNIEKIDVSKFKSQPKNKDQFIYRMKLCQQLIDILVCLHEHQFSFFPNSLEEILLIDTTSRELKLATHLCKLWRLTTEQQLKDIRTRQMSKFKKQMLANRSLKYVAPEFIFEGIPIKDARFNDVWKAGLLILTFLTGMDCRNELNALQSVDPAKIKEHVVIEESKVPYLKKYMKSNDINQILMAFKINPEERINLKNLIPILLKVESQITQSFDHQTLQLAKKRYLQQQSELRFKFHLQLKAGDELLTADHKKKITEYFKNSQNRTIKELKLFFKGSKVNFISQFFYEAMGNKRSLLLYFLQKKQKRKIITYIEQGFDISRCNGIFGSFIRDAKKLSFIYSPQENEFCKLKNADRANAVSNLMGPIIGDGDIIIGNQGMNNGCRFPLSYEQGRLKKLFKDKFELQQYEVYQVMF